MRAGGKLTADANIQFRDPIQWTKKLLAERSTDAVMKRIDSRKFSFHFKGRIDLLLTGNIR